MLAVVALTITSSAVGFSPIHSKVLALRGGGVNNDQLANLATGLNLAAGIQGWAMPENTMAMYGVDTISDEEKFMCRALSGANIMQGVTILADQIDIGKAVGIPMLGIAVSTAAQVPLLKQLDVSTDMVVGTAVVLATLGELARRGTINENVAGNINSVWLILISVIEMFKQQAVLETFGWTDPSPLTKSLMENFSWAKVNTGLFLLISKLTGKRGLGLAAAAASNTCNLIVTFTRADKVGLKKGGLLVWSALNSAIALLAFRNENA